MDNWNPIIAEAYVKRVSVWRIAAAQALLVVAVMAAVWCAAVLMLSLERGGL
jgi:hypothetical protein